MLSYMDNSMNTNARKILSDLEHLDSTGIWPNATIPEWAVAIAEHDLRGAVEATSTIVAKIALQRALKEVLQDAATFAHITDND